MIAGPATPRDNSPTATYSPAPRIAPVPREVRSNKVKHLLKGESESKSSTCFLRVKFLHSLWLAIQWGRRANSTSAPICEVRMSKIKIKHSSEPFSFELFRKNILLMVAAQTFLDKSHWESFLLRSLRKFLFSVETEKEKRKGFDERTLSLKKNYIYVSIYTYISLVYY